MSRLGRQVSREGKVGREVLGRNVCDRGVWTEPRSLAKLGANGSDRRVPAAETVRGTLLGWFAIFIVPTRNKLKHFVLLSGALDDPETGSNSLVMDLGTRSPPNEFVGNLLRNAKTRMFVVEIDGSWNGRGRSRAKPFSKYIHATDRAPLGCGGRIWGALNGPVWTRGCRVGWRTHVIGLRAEGGQHWL